MINPAPIVVGAIVAARKELVERMIREGATTEQYSIPLSRSDLRLARGTGLVKRGIVIESYPGLFYLDRERYAASLVEDRGRARIVLVVAIVALAAFLLFVGIFA